MPPRRKYRRKRNPRFRKKRRFRRATNSLSVYRPLKRTQLYKTRYVEQQIQLNPGAAGIAANYLFSANGLYDPNITGVGHQPIGFDQLVGVMYDHYVVIGAKITCIFTNTDATNAQICGVMLRDDNSTDTDPAKIIENGNCKYTSVSQAGSGPNQKKLVVGCNPNKFLGHSKPLSDDVVKGDSSGNPSEQAYFNVFAFPTTASDASPVEVMVVIDYTAILFEPKKLNLS